MDPPPSEHLLQASKPWLRLFPLPGMPFPTSYPGKLLIFQEPLLMRPAHQPSSSSQQCHRNKKRHRNRVETGGLPPSRGNNNPLSQLMAFIYYFLLLCTYRGYIKLIGTLLQTYWKQDMLGQSFLSTKSNHKIPKNNH